MRLLRLCLHRYGHLNDVALEFPERVGLHVVLGANEAGKSTTLAAIGDGLFGFPHRTNFGFLHNNDLRVGFTLQAANGQIKGFLRRKGRRDTLLDEHEAALPDTALLPFLGGTTRSRFDNVFGLDGQKLRDGGDAILKGEGEVGESILQAHTGLSGFRALVDRLGDEAGKLFGDKRGRRAFHEAADAFRDARHALESRAVDPTAWKTAQQELDELEAAQRRNATEHTALSATRTRFERIRRTAPPRATLLRATEERAALGAIPALPTDATAKRLDALAETARATHDLTRERAALADTEVTLTGLRVDQTMLDEADAIDALSADLNRIITAQRDRERQRIVVTQARRSAEEAGARLGCKDDAERLASLMPDALRRDAAQRARTAAMTLAERHATATRAAADATEILEEARAALDALPEPPDPTALRAAIATARNEGRIDETIEQVATTRATIEGKLARQLASLPGWQGDAAALEAAPVPLEAEIARTATTLAQAEDAGRACRQELATQDRILAELDLALAALTQEGDLPTADAVTALRVRRDQAWQALRRQLETGAATAADMEAVESLIQAADQLADRRIVEATRIATHDANRANAARAMALGAQAAQSLKDAEAAQKAAEATWQTLWHQAGITPWPPDAMGDWLRRRNEVLETAHVATEATQRLTTLTRRRVACRDGLVTLLPPETPVTEMLGPVLRAAEQLGDIWQDQAQARSRAAAQVRDAERAQARAAKSSNQAATARAEADIAWEDAAAALGLPTGTQPEAGQVALELWTEVERHLRDWRTAEDRVAEMTLSIDGFTDAAARAVSLAAPDLADATLTDAVRILATRLGDAREAARQHTTLSGEHARLRRTITGLTRTQDAAEEALAALRALARVADDAALADTITRTTRAAALDTEIATLLQDLARLGDGRSMAALAEEAEGMDPDTLPGQIGVIDARLAEIASENTAQGARLSELRAGLAAMSRGQDAAAASQAMQDALADIDDIATRYVRLRLAHTLLRSGIDRFRRQQQAPLLTRAGEIFCRLTDGRYEKLEADEAEDGKLILAARRADGSHCPAERLSEGTSDQLYLALRLAAIESHASAADPLPFIADDLLVNFDDQRALAALDVLADFTRTTQVILFTHHAHVAEMAAGLGVVQHLPARVLIPA